MNFKTSKTPFKYLGVLITPKNFAIIHFNHMIDSINVVVAYWGKAHLSKARKVVLINSVMLPTPIYYLSVYPIPDSVLNRMSKIARKF